MTRHRRGGRVAVGAVVMMALVTIGLPSLGAAFATRPLTAALGGIGKEVAGSAADGPGTGLAAQIPVAFLASFVTASARFDVPWGVLAGIYRLECDFGQSQLAGCNPPGTQNPAGAQGPGQILPPTWRRGLAAHQIIPLGPPTASTADGYATDGDGDGVADPWDAADAVASTARLLAANGAANGDLYRAVFSYNHDATYVDEVMAFAGLYQDTAAGLGGAGLPAGVPAGVGAVLAFADAQLGKPYLWGGAGPDRWDCSGLVQAAYRQVGVIFSHDAATQYAASAGSRVGLDQLRPGDLVFYGTSPATIHHVGISLGGTEMIDAPYTGAVVRIDPIEAADLLVATRPLGGS